MKKIILGIGIFVLMPYILDHYALFYYTERLYYVLLSLFVFCVVCIAYKDYPNKALLYSCILVSAGLLITYFLADAFFITKLYFIHAPKGNAEINAFEDMLDSSTRELVTEGYNFIVSLILTCGMFAFLYCYSGVWDAKKWI